MLVPMSDERPFTHLLCGQIHARDVSSDDEAIAQLARPQHGIVARGQLKDLGISERAIDHRAAAGRLRRLHPGVYAVGHEALSHTARVQSAVLSVAPGAATSHMTAAALWKLCDPPRGPIHVTAARKRAPKRGVAIHRGILPGEDVTILDGIPVTTVPRTLLDVSATGNPSALRRLVKQAEFERLTDTAALAAILERYPRRRVADLWPGSLTATSLRQGRPGASSRICFWSSSSAATCRDRRRAPSSRSPAGRSRWTAHGETPG
jgi:Transcriptional regulator, AbiEi antitoxin